MKKTVNNKNTSRNSKAATTRHPNPRLTVDLNGEELCRFRAAAEKVGMTPEELTRIMAFQAIGEIEATGHIMIVPLDFEKRDRKTVMIQWTRMTDAAVFVFQDLYDRIAGLKYEEAIAEMAGYRELFSRSPQADSVAFAMGMVLMGDEALNYVRAVAKER